MLRQMTWTEFLNWMVYNEMEPFGEVRADLRMAIGWSVFANANRDKKRRPKPFTPSDFMPKFGSDARRRGASGERKPLTDQSMWQRMKSTARAVFGGSKGAE